MTTPTTAAVRRPVAEVDSREELIYLLSRAAELEHALACLYLYAAHSLKATRPRADSTRIKPRKRASWKRRLAGVAVEEMLHLAQVANLLTAIGGAPNFRRSNFPVPAERVLVRHAPERSSRSRARRSTGSSATRCPRPAYSRPNGPPTSRNCAAASRRRSRSTSSARSGAANRTTSITGRSASSIIRSRAAFARSRKRRSSSGRPRPQSRGRFLDFGGQLLAITDAPSAKAAIDMIVAQGEAPTSDHPTRTSASSTKSAGSMPQRARRQRGAASHTIRCGRSSPTRRLASSQRRERHADRGSCSRRGLRSLQSLVRHAAADSAALSSRTATRPTRNCRRSPAPRCG